MQIDHLQLQGRALVDLTNRSKGGIAVYLATWLLFGFGYDLPAREPVLFYSNLFILAIIMGARLWQQRVVSRDSDNESTKRNWNTLVFLMMIAATHWGALYALVISNQELSDVHLVMFLSTIAFSIGGSSILSISNEIRIAYPLLLNCFGIIVLLMNQNSQSTILAGMSVVMLVYIYFTTRVTNQDYWQSITNEILSNNRAKEMEILSETDPLTGLKNRIYFEQKVREEWKRGSRNSSQLSILMIDLDHFKSINDTHGHATGDTCLKFAANALKNQIGRESDCIARYGGEEFAVLLPDTSREEANSMATKMLQAVRALNIREGLENIRMSCSIGGSTTIPNHHTEYEDLVKKSDVALYLAKEKGRDQYCPIP